MYSLDPISLFVYDAIQKALLSDLFRVNSIRKELKSLRAAFADTMFKNDWKLRNHRIYSSKHISILKTIQELFDAMDYKDESIKIALEKYQSSSEL